MLIQTSSLAQLAYRIGDTLRTSYDIDPQPIYKTLGIDPKGPKHAGERQPNRVISQMFDMAAEATGDPALGIRVGLASEPRHFYVIGHVWLASSTLLDALQKLLRYEAIFNTGDTVLRFERSGDLYVLSESYPNPADYPGKLRVDNGIASILKMCQVVRGEPLLAERLELLVAADAPLEIYEQLVHGPVRCNDRRNALYFRAAELEAPLKGSIPELVDATCRIADRYVASLDSSRVAHLVRAQLVQMLPGGAVDQERIAANLYRSSSTLQRQLQSEGTTYRDVLDDTRRELAESYLRDGQHSQTETAFLVGFSDQSNFARAFRRWTGMSPGEYCKAARVA
jgi:AraC-like DNA-binding protein